MKNIPSINQVQPKTKKYIIGKEVYAISIQDAIRKERSADITEVREIYCDEDEL